MSFSLRQASPEKELTQALLREFQAPLLGRIQKNNQLIKHNYKVLVRKQCPCELEGCMTVFNLELIPNQIVYPKFCQEHRTEHRRAHFVRMRALAEV